MKILVIGFDLFSAVGGGQTVYRKIIDATPQHDFYYLRMNEGEYVKRPSNAHSIKLRSFRRVKPNIVPPMNVVDYDISMSESEQIAASVAGMDFDIVDVPDYVPWGAYLRTAFQRHNVTVRRIVLAMHGNTSKARALNWGGHNNMELRDKQLETAQFIVADHAYAISPKYIDEWSAVEKREIAFIDPMNFVTTSDQLPSEVGYGPPSLYCIGRSERRKGNDIFIEMVRWLRPGSYALARHVGETDSTDGRNSRDILAEYAKRREVDVPYIPSKNRRELNELFQSASLCVLPVRYDTLNLVSLEALFSGCPTAIATGAGVCRYLDEYHPDIPYLKLDLSDIAKSIADLQHYIDNYAAIRAQLVAVLQKKRAALNVTLDMSAVYEHALKLPARSNTVSFGHKFPTTWKTPFPSTTSTC